MISFPNVGPMQNRSHRSQGAAKASRTPVPVVPRCALVNATSTVPHGVPSHRCAAQRDVFCLDASELSNNAALWKATRSCGKLWMIGFWGPDKGV